jgi:hypothetical protein
MGTNKIITTATLLGAISLGGLNLGGCTNAKLKEAQTGAHVARDAGVTSPQYANQGIAEWVCEQRKKETEERENEGPFARYVNSFSVSGTPEECQGIYLTQKERKKLVPEKQSQLALDDIILLARYDKLRPTVTFNFPAPLGNPSIPYEAQKTIAHQHIQSQKGDYRNLAWKFQRAREDYTNMMAQKGYEMVDNGQVTAWGVWTTATLLGGSALFNSGGSASILNRNQNLSSGTGISPANIGDVLRRQ